MSDRIPSDTEYTRCDFCGDVDVVAISDQGEKPSRICAPCASWAVDEVEKYRAAQERRRREAERNAARRPRD